ncbi:MAG: alanine racemase, partial [Chloroflexota bacterium]
GVDAEQLVAEFGSPLYVYDGDAIRQRVSRLRAALPDEVELAFATKANSSPAVLELLAEEGLGADVASAGELNAVRRAGFAPQRIVFTGPGKTDTELASGLRVGVGALTIESLDELDALIGMATKAQPGQGLMLRLATDGAAGEETAIIGAEAGIKFGLTDGEADDAVRRLVEADLLAPTGPFVLRGFHAFGASNVLDADVLVRGVMDLARRAERIATRHGISIELLDAGGGLGIPYADAETPLDLAALGEGVRGELETWRERTALREARLLFEPGRWFTGPAGAYLCRVLRTKQRGEHVIAVTDGGIHHLLRPRLVGQDHRVVPVGMAARRDVVATVDVVGPLCTGLDYLASGIEAPVPRSGDLYAVLDAGAYGYSESMPFFLSHPIPAEIVVEAGSISVSRDRIEPE